MNVDVVLRDRKGQREGVSMRWGLAPYFWKKSLKQAPVTFTRAQTVAEKPMFRDAWSAGAASIRRTGFRLGVLRREFPVGDELIPCSPRIDSLFWTNLFPVPPHREFSASHPANY
jgi:hypothetical protein